MIFIKIEDDLTFYETYEDGTICKLPNRRFPRKMTVEYVCSEKGSLLEVNEKFFF